MIDVKPCDPKQTRVLLLKGGTSGEREISLISAKGVAEGLRAEGFPVQEIDTGRDGYLHQIADAECDVVFICLHGNYGEDGTVQGLVKLMGKPFVGPGVLASALAMDKVRSKVIYKDAGLPTADYVVIEQGQTWDRDAIVSVVGEKSVVKPSANGSALDVSIAHDPSELDACIATALKDGGRCLVERYVAGMEATVPVLGNEDPMALPVIEIIPKNEFYDYESKYAPGGSRHVIPARLSDDVLAECQRIAVEAHKALGCVGVSRSDIKIDDEGNPWILETNTIPGMTQTSLLPDAAAKIGISYSKLCRMMVELALMARSDEDRRQAQVRP